MSSLAHLQLTIIDYITLAILLLSALLGIWRGLFKELISLASWFAAAWLSYHYCFYLASEWISAVIPNRDLQYGAAFLIIFITVLIAAALIGKLMQTLISSAGLGFLDRLLGFLFGFFRGALIVVVLATLTNLVGIQQSIAWQQAVLRPTLETGMGLIKTWLPPDWAKLLDLKTTTGLYQSIRG